MVQNWFVRMISASKPRLKATNFQLDINKRGGFDKG